MKRNLLIVGALVFGFAVGRVSQRERVSPRGFEFGPGTSVSVAYPVDAVAQTVAREPRPVVGRQNLRVFRHDTPGASQWRETAWVLRVGPHEFVAAPE